MIPYLYTMNRRAAFDNEPLVQPLYWDYPEIEAAYKLTDEFRFGTELLVAPIVDQPTFRAACEGRRVAAAGRMVRFLRRSPLRVSSGRRPPSGGLARSRPHAGVR